jgi:hypothetical protein
MDAQRIAMVSVLAISGIAVVMLPFWHYFIVGWRAKRKDIMDGLNADARLVYFQMFSRSETMPSAATASVQFEKLYSRWYGRRFFITPGLLLFVVSASAATLVVLSGLERLHYLANPLVKLPDIAMAAIAGAYLWVVNDFISRARRLDFAPSDVMWGVLRLIISVPMGYAFAAIASKSVGPFVAFALGAFPLTTLNSMLQRLANKNLQLQSTDDETADDVVKLQGLNRAIVERLSNEDITSITQVAYCDPVRLIMRSNLSFNSVTDGMNQALAWMYLQDDLNTVRPLGMRGAVEIRQLISDYDGVGIAQPGGQQAHDRAVAAIPLIAAAIKQDPATLQVVFRQIADDPYTIFLEKVWT